MARVLIATDGSDAAMSAARRAVSLFGDRIERCAVVNVVSLGAELAAGGTGLIGGQAMALPVADPATAAELDDERRRQAQAMLTNVITELGIDADAIVASGDPATEICRIASEGNYDVVVVGSHGSGFVKRVLVGSVSHHVVQHSPVPVLVVREPRRE